MARIIMSALQVAGFLIATQTGLAYAQTIDPTQNTQGAVLGNFMTLLGTTLIFLTNLHHLAIGAIAGSYRMLPPGGHLPTGDMAQLVIQLTSSSFALGFQLAAPFLVFGFAVYAGLGVLAQLMPQLQIFFVAVPINILCGFLIMLALLGSLMTRVPELLHHLHGDVSVAQRSDKPMADDQDKSQQTEEPTAKRLEQAREAGDVVKSTEVTTFVLLARRHLGHRHVRQIHRHRHRQRC